MSQIKREIERLAQQRSTALTIAVDAGVLKPCEFHDDVFLETGEDIVDAYKLGNFRRSRGDFDGLYATPLEMTDSIKAVVADEGIDSCPRCENSLRD
jgi:hypothetical protein